MKKTHVINYFKRPSKVAEVLKTTVGAISQWGEVIPEKSAARLEKLTDGDLVYDPKVYMGSKASVS